MLLLYLGLAQACPELWRFSIHILAPSAMSICPDCWHVLLQWHCQHSLQVVWLCNGPLSYGLGIHA